MAGDVTSSGDALPPYVGVVNACLAVALLLLLVLWYAAVGGRKARWPPGPSGYPVLGNLPQLDTKHGLHVSFAKWQEKYGDVFKIQLGGRPALVLSGFDAIHDAFVGHGDEFMDRPQLYLPTLMFRGRGLLFQPFSPLWKETRKLAIQTMRDLGVGKSSLEEKIVEEVTAIQSEIVNRAGKPFRIRRLIQNAMANVICNINFGNRFDYEDAKFQKLLDHLNEFFWRKPSG